MSAPVCVEPDPDFEARARCGQAARILDAMSSRSWSLKHLEAVQTLLDDAAAWRNARRRTGVAEDRS